jgi:hypothetical protein
MTTHSDEHLTTDDLAGAAGGHPERRPFHDTARTPGAGQEDATPTVSEAGRPVPEDAARDDAIRPDTSSQPRTSEGDAPTEAPTFPTDAEQGEYPTTPEAEAETPPLFPREQAADFRERWAELQAQFVDAPQEAVRASDALVAEVMQTLATSFAQHKGQLEHQWTAGDMQTEGLRQAFRRYRTFFERLLSA